MKGESVMERIASFQVDHVRLNRGLYVSRIDEINGKLSYKFWHKNEASKQGDR